MDIFLEVSQTLQRVCLKKNHCIEAFRFLKPEYSSGVGSCFWGRVIKTNPALGFSFLDIGAAVPALIPLVEKGFQPLCEGEKIRVQIIRDPFLHQGKGAKVSRRLTFKSGPFVYTPGERNLFFAKQLTTAQKKSLKDELTSLALDLPGVLWVSPMLPLFLPKSFSFHLTRLQRQAQRALHNNDLKIGLISSPLSFLEQLLQEVVGLREGVFIFLDDANVASALRKAFTEKELFLLPVISLKPKNVFDEEMEDIWESLPENRIPLLKGGCLMIEETEALTSFDLNTGGAPTSSSFQANLDAIPEIFRQIRLKCLSGILIVDFLSMKLPQDRKQIDQMMRMEARNQQLDDIEFFGFSRLGLFEMVRSRRGPSLMSQLKRIRCKK